MAQPIFPSDSELDEKPRPMVFDGWGFVPLTQAEPKPTEAETRDEAAA